MSVGTVQATDSDLTNLIRYNISQATAYNSLDEVVQLDHERCRQVYGEGMRRDLEDGWSRGEVVSMARLGSGRSLELGGIGVGLGWKGRGNAGGVERMLLSPLNM